MSRAFDVITMGRIGVDIYPLQIGVPLEGVETFGKYLGGSATNVAVAAARLGARSAVISRTGADPFGRFVHNALAEFGVDDRWVTEVAGLPTPVTFCEIFPPDDFPLYFYRQPKAPDLEIAPDELDLDAIARARIFWMTGTGLCAEPSRAATLAALRHRQQATDRVGHTVFDLDWRPMFWSDSGSAQVVYREAVRHVTVAVGNTAEVAVLTGTTDPHRALDILLELGVRLAVIKLGPDGVLAGTAVERVLCPPIPVEVVNGLGAGDAFGGALCDGLLLGLSLRAMIDRANAAGAIVASRLACSPAMPYPHEIAELVTARR